MKKNHENYERREMGEGKIAFHAKASRGERVKLGIEFGTQELMKERWEGGVVNSHFYLRNHPPSPRLRRASRVSQRGNFEIVSPVPSALSCFLGVPVFLISFSAAIPSMIS